MTYAATDIALFPGADDDIISTLGSDEADIVSASDMMILFLL